MDQVFGQIQNEIPHSWKVGEITITNLPGMEEISNFNSIANSPEAEEAFGK